LPKLFGDDTFTRQTLRFVWHLLTVPWYGFAVLISLQQLEQISRASLLKTIAATFAITALVALVASKGKHLSWIVFGAISAICFFAAPVA